MDQNEKYIFLGGLFTSIASMPRNGIFSGNAVYVFGNIVNPNKRYRAGLVKLDPDSAFLY